MYELNRIEEILTTCAKLQEQITRFDSPEFMAQYSSATAYAAKYGALGAVAGMAAREAAHALELIQAAKREVAILARLQTVMERLEVYANFDDFSQTENTRELKLLEVLTTDARWRSDVSDIKEVIYDSLRDVEENQWEQEHDAALASILAAGFSSVEEDDQRWHRSMSEGQDETIVVEIDRRNRKSFGYKFKYTRNGQLICSGKSGEFANLIAQVAPMPAVQSA